MRCGVNRRSGGENATEVRYKQRRGTGFRREDEGNECPDE